MTLAKIIEAIEILATKRVEYDVVKRFPEFYPCEDLAVDEGFLMFRFESVEGVEVPLLLQVWFERNDFKHSWTSFMDFCYVSWDAFDVIKDDEYSEEENEEMIFLKQKFDSEFFGYASDLMVFLGDPDEYGSYLYEYEPEIDYQYLIWHRKDLDLIFAEGCKDKCSGRDMTLWASTKSFPVRLPMEF